MRNSQHVNLDRHVRIRVTEDDYQRLEKFAEDNGLRNVSEALRKIIHLVLEKQ